jgi:Tol biopolymer transport system component
MSMMPTNADITAKGAIIGTLQYMAPEQLEEEEADARTDVFAFGAMLYEMVTGRKAFEGKSQASLIAAIMHFDPPPLMTHQPLTPPLLDRVVRKCLEKDPEDRWQSARDLLTQLNWIVEGGRQIDVPAPIEKRGPGRYTMAAWSIALLLIGAAAALVLSRSFSPTPRTEPPIMRFDIEAPVTNNIVSPSPDGKRLLVLEQGGRLWVRSLDQLSGQSLPGVEGALTPFWSADSRFIGFFAAGKLKKVDLFGGPPQTICDVSGDPSQTGGTWNNDGVILFGSDSGPIFRVAAAGGRPTPVTELDRARGETSHVRPHFLPDGRHFLFLARSTKSENTGIFADSVEKRSPKFIVNSPFGAAFASPDYLLYLREGTLMAQRFDPFRLQLEGDPISLVSEQLGTNPYMGLAAFGVSEAGPLAYRIGSNVGTELRLVDRDGKEAGAPFGGINVANPVLSPDEQAVAVSRYEAGSDLWIFDRIRGGSTKFTFDPARDNNPIWSPDGKNIVFSSDRDGGVGAGNLYMKAAGGAGQEELLLRSDTAKVPTDWSRDGRFVIYENRDPRTQGDLVILPMSGSSGDRKPMDFLRTPFSEVQARFSPDGRWIAYASTESGRPEVYVQSFPRTGGKWLISNAGGFQPRWRADGKELFYITDKDNKGSNAFMAVDILTMPGDSEFKAGVPKKLFAVNVVTANQRNSYDVTRDGQRFLLNTPAAAQNPTVTLVLNWTAALNKK